MEEETDRQLTAYSISNCEEMQKMQYSILLLPQLAIHAVFLLSLGSVLCNNW